MKMAKRFPSIVVIGKTTSARSALTVSPVIPLGRMRSLTLPACALAHVELCGSVDGVVANATLVKSRCR